MGVYNSAHIIHTAVTHFDIVTVEYFLENMLFWKMFVNQMKELSADIGRHMLTKRWIEPNYIAVALTGGVAGIATFGVRLELKGVVIASVVECLLI